MLAIGSQWIQRTQKTWVHQYPRPNPTPRKAPSWRSHGAPSSWFGFFLSLSVPQLMVCDWQATANCDDSSKFLICPRRYTYCVYNSCGLFSDDLRKYQCVDLHWYTSILCTWTNYYPYLLSDWCYSCFQFIPKSFESYFFLMAICRCPCSCVFVIFTTVEYKQAYADFPCPSS